MTTDPPLWHMSLSGSELARITREGEDLVLTFAVAQVQPATPPRFGRGDDTAYLPGVVLRLEGASGGADPTPDGLLGRLMQCDLLVGGVPDGAPSACRRSTSLPLPGDVAGPLTLTLRSALDAEWAVPAQRLSLRLCTAPGAPSHAWPSLAC